VNDPAFATLTRAPMAGIGQRTNPLPREV
jgi:hypothetical protein